MEPKPDRNSLGKAAFIIGIIALVLSFIPFIGAVSWLLAPLAILFGAIACFRPSRSLAIAGIVTGAIALAICFSWVSATSAAIDGFNADTFSKDGKSIAEDAPIIDASIKGVWRDLDNNKLAAGKKYGGQRLRFTNEKIADILGDSNSPAIVLDGPSDGYLVYNVSARFLPEHADEIAKKAKGEKITFICSDISESLTGGYSLSSCTIN